MSRRRKVSVVAWCAALVSGGALVAVACFSGDPITGPLPAECRQLAIEAGFDPADADVEVVGIRDFAFIPAEITIARGTRVVWVNCEDDAALGHTTTSDDGVWDSGSPFLTQGGTYDRVFNGAGSYPYHCTPHPFMQGTVTVTAS